MVTSTASIKTALETRIESVLGLTKLVFIEDIAKNPTNATNNRYGVQLTNSNEDIAGSVTRNLQLRDSFTVKLTNEFVDNQYSSNLDDIKVALNDSMKTVYLDFINTKLNIPSIVIDIQNLSVSFDSTPDDNVLVLVATFDVLYRESV